MKKKKKRERENLRDQSKAAPGRRQINMSAETADANQDKYSANTRDIRSSQKSEKMQSASGELSVNFSLPSRNIISFFKRSLFS